MVILIKNSRGVGLLEAFLAAMIFIIGMSAIFSTLYSLRKPVVNNEKAVEAAHIASSFLDELRSKIDARDAMGCDENGYPGDYCGDLKEGDNHTKSIDNYTINWTVACVDPNDPSTPVSPCESINLTRKVVATVTWPD